MIRDETYFGQLDLIFMGMVFALAIVFSLPWAAAAPLNAKETSRRFEKLPMKLLPATRTDRGNEESFQLEVEK